MVLISHVDFSLCTIFKPNWNKFDINDNNDKYSNRHISIEIINFEKTETTWGEYR